MYQFGRETTNRVRVERALLRNVWQTITVAVSYSCFHCSCLFEMGGPAQRKTRKPNLYVLPHLWYYLKRPCAFYNSLDPMFIQVKDCARENSVYIRKKTRKMDGDRCDIKDFHQTHSFLIFVFWNPSKLTQICSIVLWNYAQFMFRCQLDANILLIEHVEWRE